MKMSHHVMGRGVAGSESENRRGNLPRLGSLTGQICIISPALDQHNVKRLLQQGVCVSLHSDDPAYFGGYITANYLAAQRALHLQPTAILQLARNGVQASFLSDREKEKLLNEIQEHAARL
jgi:adenine deaminase